MSITSAEIASQPTVWARALLEQDRSALGLPGERVLFLGCGTSAFVAESLAVLRERAGDGETDAAYASEWTPGRRYDRVVAITRSGSTSEVLAALALVDPGTPTAAITAVTHEAVHALVDSTLVLGFADEESVVQTRFPSALLILARQAYGYDVTGVPEAAAAAIAEPLGIDVTAFDHFVYLGSGWTYGLAQEAALKVREAAQAWSESYPLLDYRHGPIAVAHPGSLVWIFGAVELDLIADIEATGATVRSDFSDPLVQLVQAQRLAVALAESRGLDPDKPRHLTRSVILH
ncbi:sugar isomerase [Lacisediminihabitans sp.]|jgi:fructoselysine-6-P-deglycase FrlB-like protein|uniref:SIS domain-containing protein n=1 Tax=Lacisediminihabitans sp. TaxID=2787631 RepID=UPI002F934A95